MTQSLQKIMVFGRPGSGKSTFAVQLAQDLSIPVYHIDKIFFEQAWIKRERSEFLELKQEWIDKDESKAEFNSDMFNLMITSKNLVEQRVNNGIESSDKETSFEYQEFVKTYNEINKKYKLGLDKLE